MLLALPVPGAATIASATAAKIKVIEVRIVVSFRVPGPLV